MKLLLLHGPAKGASRNKLLSVKEKFEQNNVIVFEEGVDIKIILDNLTTQSLFEEERLIILENPLQDFTNYTLNSSPYTLVLWFDHEVPIKKPIMEWAKKNGQVFFFSEGREVTVFPLLDCLAFGDKKAFLEIQKLRNGGFDIQYLITMLFYLLRNLTVIPKNAPPFVKQKLERQRGNFDFEKITNLYKEILEIDFKIKSGNLEKPHAEFLLINAFINKF